ncbi:hypothetical protein CRE_14854 [Caenorhabditis remanei]|uniref:Uncharacterized protein n=1 Tax=Caenorhabditis remanei TaxID=31234 RepID=E3N1R6_CAERE|nr:hypothetical protein CRE_14854 [Caenorhabditis remanei]
MKPTIILLLFTVSVSARMFPTYPDTDNRVKPIKIPIIQKEPSNSELTDIIGSRKAYEEPEISVIESLKQMEFLLKDITNDMITFSEPPSTTPSTTKSNPAIQDVTDLKKVAKVKKYKKYPERSQERPNAEKIRALGYSRNPCYSPKFQLAYFRTFPCIKCMGLRKIAIVDSQKITRKEGKKKLQLIIFFLIKFF